MIKIKNQKSEIKKWVSSGFTLVELVIVTSITIILLGFITINLVRSQQKTSLASVREILLTDLKEQQIKAMVGETEGRLDSDSYGIHFDLDRYVLFHGTTYNSSDPSNYIKNLDQNMRFNNSGYNVIFSRLSGEIPTPTTIELEDISNSEGIEINLNELGVVTRADSL